MTAPATTVRPSAATTSRPSWPRVAGILILTGGVLLTAATALEIGTDVAVDTGPALAFRVLFLASTLAHVTAMFPLALGRGDGEGAVGSSTVGKLALLGFAAFFLASQSLYLLVASLLPTAEPTDGATVFLVGMRAVQGILLLVGGLVIVRARVLTGAARWAILALSIIAFALGVVVATSSVEALTNTMYFVSTGAQIVAGLLIARAGIGVAK
ncbi:hypothetical protein [Microbacterium trichothecenolyticum]|uniref:Uncharacterized protein n=1 Tax=Microbacterium trichothecenolyticum TaxID=69370 RepID=A0ABU0TVE1_MICTR|nr:hypothetical protein [Microbacterium trichothecenolyticum]MDQ1123639.1 hypothetical protein [Microbacterium trichothecenolyticum]